MVGGAVHPYPVERFVEVTERISYTVDHTTNPDCQPDSGTAVIYSDGSVLPGQWAGCGIAFATITGDWVTSGRKLPSHSTPLQAEILGIWLAASTGSSQPHVARVVVLSDCMRAIDALTGRNGSLTGGRLAQLVLDRLSKLGKPVSVHYTPSKQTEGNLKADTAARTAALHGLDVEMTVPFSREALSTLLTRLATARSSAQYEEEVRSLGRSFRFFVPTSSALSALRSLGSLDGIWHLVSSRNNLRYSRSHVDRGSATCPLCDSGEDEDIPHFLFRCHRWRLQRKALKAAVVLRGIPWPVQHGDIFLRDRSLAEALESFISLTRRLSRLDPLREP
ncbi:hypothetical protein FOZ61_003279 [Perkinsus olseni]|uniref:RNase H type-1 domain-containing protein n=1 Tax=Perkinsus olseni TaxID=32597 RepID=A0A7J6LT79_PEROL|nr:hypothetical protein FOL46_005264 [Perkinsus olseni]KAF4671342.1 hypothetical protein FOZ61_003279 [Perkinsus olseni]